MLTATELMGAKTYDAQGNYVGKVREFFVEPAEQPNRVAHFLLARGSFQPLVARHDQVAAIEAGKLELNVPERALDAYQPNEGWLAVTKDLLDQQIIDTSGRKVVRVNDLDLAEQRTNGNVELRITQVDVGLPGAVRRLLQGVVAPGAKRACPSQKPSLPSSEGVLLRGSILPARWTSLATGATWHWSCRTNTSPSRRWCFCWC